MRNYWLVSHRDTHHTRRVSEAHVHRGKRALSPSRICELAEICCDPSDPDRLADDNRVVSHVERSPTVPLLETEATGQQPFQCAQKIDNWFGSSVQREN